MYAAYIFISKAIRTTREMITKRISGQQKQPGSFILQAEPLSRSYHVAESTCRIYNTECKSKIDALNSFDERVLNLITIQEHLLDI